MLKRIHWISVLAKDESCDSYESFLSPGTIFAVVGKLDKLINDILIPQFTLCMLQKGKQFEIENEEMKVFLGRTIMMSYNALPELH